MTATPRTAGYPLLEPSGRDEWRAWLEVNHVSSPGVWLAVGKKGNQRTTLTYEDAVLEALRFNWIDSTVNRLDADRFKQLFTPRRTGSTWSASNKQRVERLDAEGLLTPVAIAAIEAAKADGSWSQLDDVDALVVPDDLAAALAEDDAAECGFHSLTASQRKLALYWIASAKRPETRATRIAETVRAASESRPSR